MHGHCRHEAVLRFDAEAEILSRSGLDWERLASGCCGMAGSFGYERDKVAVSIAAGERVLLPAVRGAHPSTLAVADGFSCKEQISGPIGARCTSRRCSRWACRRRRRAGRG